MKKNRIIGLIGFGHLGKSIVEHLQPKLEGDRLLVSVDRKHNKEIARKSDILFLTVRPTHILKLLDEIRGDIAKGAVIISFMAAVPADFIARGIPNTVIRAMTDIHLRQIISVENETAVSVLSKISKNPLLKTKKEGDIDAFTVLVGCLPGISAWQFVNNLNAEKWLKDYAFFVESKLGVPHTVTLEIIDEVRRKGDFQSTIATVATKGGVTECLLQALTSHGKITFPELFIAGMEKISELADLLIGSHK